MKIDFDPNKSNKNACDRDLPFERAAYFDWETALYAKDARQIYAERRFIAIGYLHQRLHVICFTPITGGMRVISFRKANLPERQRYEKESLNH